MKWDFHYIQGGPKKHGTVLLSISSPIIDWFSKFFHWHTLQQFATTCLLHIPPQHKCVFTLPCEMSMKYALLTIITNKHFGKIDKKHIRPTLQWMVCMTLDCVGLTQSSVIQIIQQCWSKVYFHLPKFLLLSLVFAYVYISQGSVETH